VAPGGIGAANDLHQAATLAPDSRLGTLLQRRQALEQRLRGLSGVPGQGSSPQDAAFAARFPVASFAQRQAEQSAWETRRQALQQQADDLRRNGAAPAAMPDGLADTPLAQQLGAGLPDLATTGLGSSLGRTRSQIGAGLSRLRPLGERARQVADTIDDAGRPLREAGQKVGDYNRQLRDLDQRLASEGVSEADRAEVRRATGADTIDKTSQQMDRANAVLGAPKALVDKVDSGWRDREDRITAPMDRRSDYSHMRDRRLSTESGGSGDLFERMMQNRQSALERRQEALDQEARDQRRRDRARETSATRPSDDRTSRERQSR
jgi:hypothetical protein